MKKEEKKRIRRHKRIRSKILGTLKMPRLCVFRSEKHIYAQLINDEKGKTLASSSDFNLKNKKILTKEKTTGKTSVAFEVGKLIAEKAIALKIEKVVFDRGGYKYHGNVKALAEGAREGGLKF